MKLKNFIVMLVSTILFITWYKYGIGFTTYIFRSYSVIVVAIVIGTFFILWSFFIYQLYDEFVEWKSALGLKKSTNTNTKPINLYLWLGNLEFKEKYFYDMLDEDSQEDFFENLKIAKKKLSKRIGKKIGDYYLLRNSLENIKSERDKFSSVVKSFVIPIIISCLTGLTVKLFDIKGKFDGVPQLEFTSETFAILCFAIALFIIIIRMSSTIFKITTMKERRIDGLLLVINAIISEKERGK